MLAAVLLMMMPQPLLPEDPDKDKKPKREKMVCRSATPVGSRISERVCKTAAEWEALAHDTRQGMDRFSGNNNTVHPPKLPGG